MWNVLGWIVALALSALAPAILSRLRHTNTHNDDHPPLKPQQTAADEQPQPNADKPKSGGKKQAAAAAAAAAATAAADRARQAADARPVLSAGDKCYYTATASAEPVAVKVRLVHFDDDPPYYTIELPDGKEKGTVRSRLDSFEEHANAIAEALLQEEEKEKSQRKGSKARKTTSAHEKRAKKKA